jgi:hypothetical protein
VNEGPRVGQEVLVDTSCYGVRGQHWCLVVRVLPEWSAGVYPVKVQVPDRGIGQFKASECMGVRECAERDADREDAFDARRFFG